MAQGMQQSSAAPADAPDLRQKARDRKRFQWLLGISIYQLVSAMIGIVVMIVVIITWKSGGDQSRSLSTPLRSHTALRQLRASKEDQFDGFPLWLLAVFVIEGLLVLWELATIILYLLTRPLCIVASARYLRCKGSMPDNVATEARQFLRLGYVADINMLILQALGVVLSIAGTLFDRALDPFAAPAPAPAPAQPQAGTTGSSPGLIIWSIFANALGLALMVAHAWLCRICARTLDALARRMAMAAGGTEREALLPQEPSSPRAKESMAE